MSQKDGKSRKLDRYFSLYSNCKAYILKEYAVGAGETPFFEILCCVTFNFPSVTKYIQWVKVDLPVNSNCEIKTEIAFKRQTQI